LPGVNPDNRGAVALRDFLEYAERNGKLPAEPPILTGAETNVFEESVRAALVDRGLTIDMQVGAGRYRIDLAVRDPQNSNRYVLGIECDGATYHSARSARDRDLLRQLVLQRMGWRIYRVWSTEWFHNPELVIEKICNSVQMALQTQPTHPVAAPPIPCSTVRQGLGANVGTPPAPPAPRQYKAGVPYSSYKTSPLLDPEHVLRDSFTEALSSTVVKIVDMEGPIHREILLKRIKEAHGILKLGRKMRRHIERALAYGILRSEIACDPSSQFFNVPGRELTSFRVPENADARPVEYIAPAEIELAILYIVEDQVGVIEEYLPVVVARLIGIKKVKAKDADKIRTVIEELVNSGKLRRAGSHVHLA
jgi:very-short-patch-repair endonuclease